jgi:hypothetical protein
MNNAMTRNEYLTDEQNTAAHNEEFMSADELLDKAGAELDANEKNLMTGETTARMLEDDDIKYIEDEAEENDEEDEEDDEEEGE